MISTIEENIKIIKEKIAEAALRTGRNPSDVNLMAVSKTKPLEEAVAAAECGVLLGENYVQEFKDKFDARPDLPWHFIGHLQKNKVKYVVPRALMIHSVDSFELAEKISLEAEKREKEVSCLVEINSGDEENKFGLTIGDSAYIIDMIKKIMELPNIKVKGLMTVAPFVENGEKNREIFKKMKSCFDEVKSICSDADTLSMGMSGDFEVAAEEGATIVRVGTKIFGERNYNKQKG
ncbi:MAG: YggS family pyridoxal phosphate-dependent enzyme [Clostridia bacterium]|nr:YggS family pyridoxal phosphate-dependent enzyme [Clostridia bacterium]